MGSKGEGNPTPRSQDGARWIRQGTHVNTVQSQRLVGDPIAASYLPRSSSRTDELPQTSFSSMRIKAARIERLQP